MALAAASAPRGDKVAAATSSTSLYDNVASAPPAHQAPPKREFVMSKLFVASEALARAKEAINYLNRKATRTWGHHPTN